MTEEPLSMDQAFIRKLSDIVLANISDENFSAEKLAGEAGMSHASLHRKIKAITSLDISQFIKEVRLKRAMEMLQKNEGTAAEIAYRVGFGSATYFNRCFHEYFGYPPGEVRKKASQQTVTVSGEEKHDYQPDSDKAKKKNQTVFLRNKFTFKKQIIIISGLLSGVLLVYILYSLLIVRPSSGRKNSIKEKSIVVLPFKNLSDEIENQYFADGIMEGILNNLFRISNLRVVSRTTSEHFRENPMTSPEMAKMLKVNYVLEGSVIRFENKIRIFVQLIDARSDQHILSEKYEGEMSNIFGLQSEIARKVAGKLEAALSRQEIGQIEKMPTNNPEAYDFYLKGRFLMNKASDVKRADISREGLLGSIPYFEKAVAADDRFAEAYAGMADAWYNLSAWGWHKPYKDGIEKAREFSSRALAIDSACAEAHAVKGACFLYPDRQFGEAARELITSIRLNPNYSLAHQWYAQLLMITGPIEEARVHMDRVLELEPYFWLTYNLNSWILYFEGKHKKGIEACRTGRDLNPYSLDNDWLFVIHYSKLGEGDSALKELKSIFVRYLKTDRYENGITEAYMKSGIPGLYLWLTDFNKTSPLPLEGLNGHPFYISWWNAILNNREESLYWLTKVSESQYIPFHYFDLITTNPDFDFVRDDPAFLKILESYKLAPYNRRKAR